MRSGSRRRSRSGQADISAELALVDEFLEDPARAGLVMLALGAMVSSVAAHVARERAEPREEVLARMMDGALKARWWK